MTVAPVAEPSVRYGVNTTASCPVVNFVFPGRGVTVARVLWEDLARVRIPASRQDKILLLGWEPRSRAELATG